MYSSPSYGCFRAIVVSSFGHQFTACCHTWDPTLCSCVGDCAILVSADSVEHFFWWFFHFVVSTNMPLCCIEFDVLVNIGQKERKCNCFVLEAAKSVRSDMVENGKQLCPLCACSLICAGDPVPTKTFTSTKYLCELYGTSSHHSNREREGAKSWVRVMAVWAWHTGTETKPYVWHLLCLNAYIPVKETLNMPPLILAAEIQMSQENFETRGMGEKYIYLNASSFRSTLPCMWSSLRTTVWSSPATFLSRCALVQVVECCSFFRAWKCCLVQVTFLLWGEKLQGARPGL